MTSGKETGLCVQDGATDSPPQSSPSQLLLKGCINQNWLWELGSRPGHTISDNPQNMALPSLRRCLLLLFHSCSLMAPAITATASGSPPRSGQYHQKASHPKSVFILAGQSNMAGRGGVPNDTSAWDGFIPNECRPSPSILRLDAGLQWTEAQEPLHLGIDTTKKCGIGPGMPLAHTLLRNHIDHGRSIGAVGLVPCAVGGTNISEWRKGSRLYERLVRRARSSVRDGGIIQAVVWYQGESDTVNKVDAEGYKGKLEKLIGDLRTDLRSPVLPIILVAIASGNGPYIEKVRQAQLAINLLNVRVVDAKGSAFEPDHLHLTTPAQVHLGVELAHAFLNFLPSPTQTNTQPSITYSSSSSERDHHLRPNTFRWPLCISVIIFITSVVIIAF